MNLIKKIPLPVCGVALGLATLGNLLQSYSEGVRAACGVVSGLLLALFLIKCLAYPKTLADDLKNPIMASVAATFPMTLMLLAAYLKPVLGAAAQVLWFTAIALHLALIVYFTIKFILKLDLSKVFASYYIVYVGIAVAGVSAPAFGQEGVGALSFWFGLITLVLLLVLVTTRYVKEPEVPAPAVPLICIYAAPTSLCVAAYVQSVTPKSMGLLLVLYVVASVLYVFALVQAVGVLRGKFFPSWASLTFPFVISAIASKQTMACLANLGSPQAWLAPVVLVETAIAAALVLYVLVRYVMFVCAPEETSNPVKAQA